MLKQHLAQKMMQKLSPQQIQLMKLLQVPTAMLEQRIKEELEANPALEEGGDSLVDDILGNMDSKDENAKDEVAEVGQNEDLDMSEYLADEEMSYKTSTGVSRNDDENKAIPIAVEQSFNEHLIAQLGLLKLNESDEVIARQILGSIDEDGYLRRELMAISDDLAFQSNVEVDEETLVRVLEIVQKMDPAGVGARDLQECLLIQLNREIDKGRAIELDTSKQIIEKYFDQFSKKHYERLKKQLGIDSEELKEAIEEILKLNPKPGAAFTDTSKIKHNYIVPDFIIANNNGELELSLNTRNAPELRISNSYRHMLEDYQNKSKKGKKDKKQKDAVLFIKRKIDSAKWFIDAIKQRQATMYNTMSTILNYQYDYFFTGDETKLKPMILKDIAEITELDISTISRVSNSKYVQTEFGTFKLKSFFSESLSTDSGEEVSTREVKKILQNFIEAEAKTKPLSDQKLTDLLKEKGYNIARRTVAKYREQLNIPVARLRKEL